MSKQTKEEIIRKIRKERDYHISTDELIKNLRELIKWLDPKVAPIKVKENELFGGGFITDLGLASKLVRITKSSSTDSVLVPDKKLIIEVVDRSRKIFKEVDEIVEIVKHDLLSFENSIVLIRKDLIESESKKNEYYEQIKEMTKYIEKQEKQNEHLRKNIDDLMEMKYVNPE